MLTDILRYSWWFGVEFFWVSILIMIWVWALATIEIRLPKLKGHPWVVIFVTGTPILLLGPGVLLTAVWISFLVAFTYVSNVQGFLLEHFKWMKAWHARWLFFLLLCCVFVAIRQTVKG